MEKLIILKCSKCGHQTTITQDKYRPVDPDIVEALMITNKLRKCPKCGKPYSKPKLVKITLSS